MLIVLDNAESILEPQGTNAREIYAVVELSRLETICLCITSRISTISPDCGTLDIPTLPIEPARDAFHRIHKNGVRIDLADSILEQLEFYPLWITLLATVSHHNKWDYDRLSQEWDARRTQVLQTDYNNSLAAAIELSLSSPMFQELGPDAKGLLGVVAFFPQGVDKNNLDWLFPTISDRKNIFNKFCVLSLTYKETASSQCWRHSETTFDLSPGRPGYEEARWITSEDVNVEHLLDVFTSVEVGSDNVWNTCANFMGHLCWHKPRLAVLGPKLERLPDN
jgi:hypothetical protein